MTDKFVVGVTGGIGSGKTAATDVFQQLGIYVVDADEVAREVVEPGKPALQAIVAVFGEGILVDDGTLNRAKLRELIFSDDASKQQLNDIMFPAIRNALIQQLSDAKSDYVILSAPLLLENKLQKYTNRVLVIDVPVAVQIERASKRDDVNEAQIKAIIASQIGREERLSLADDVLDNSQQIEQLAEKVHELHQKYLLMK